MAAFAVHVHMLTSKPKVRMGFKPDGVKRSTSGYLEPDFLKSLGASRETVECRGASDEVRREREGAGGGGGKVDREIGWGKGRWCWKREGIKGRMKMGKNGGGGDIKGRMGGAKGRMGV